MDREKVEQLIEKSKALNLMGLDFIAGLGVQGVCDGYNGIGPQFLDEKLRNGVTRFLGVFEPAAMIHDCRYDKADRSKEAFDYANCEFFVNCHKCAKAKYRWYDWRRYRAYIVIDALYEYVCSENGGWRAWVEASSKNGK